MRKRFTGALALLVGASLVLAGCSGGKGGTGGAEQLKVKPADFTQAAYADLKDGGTLTTAVPEISPQHNPFQQDGTAYTSILWYWYNPQIILFKEDGTAYANPDFITKMEAKEVGGKTVVTYDINEKAKYNNDQPITWKAFETTWKVNSGSDKKFHPNSTDGYEQIESVKAGTSDKQAIVTFKSAYAWWQGIFNMLATPNMADAEVFEKAYVSKVHPEWGAGPYKLKKLDAKAGVIEFEPNEKWWGNKAKLTSRVFKVMEDQASINAFKNGEIDATGVGTKDRLAQVKDMKGIKLYTAFRPSSVLLMLNSKSDALKDIKVREAVFTAIDRKTLSSIRFNGLNYEEAPPGSFTLFPIQPGYKDNFSAAVKYDPKKAQKLLEEAGYTKGADGIFEKGGKKLTLRLPQLGDNPIIKASDLALQKMLKDSGINVEIQNKPTSEFSNVITKVDFDIFGMGFSSSDPFGVAYFGQIYGSNSGLNKSGTGTKELDAKIAELQKIADPKAQIEAANKLEVEAFKTYGIMPTMNGPDISAVKEGLANYGSMGFTKIPVQDIGYVK